MEGWLGASLLVAGFLALCRLLGLLASARRVLDISNAAFTVMGNPTLDEDTREQEMQRHAISLFGLFLRLFVGGAVAVLIPAGCLWLLDLAGWLSLEASLDTGFSLTFILLVTVVSIITWLAWRHFHSQETKQAQPGSEYSAMDRLLHRAAFASVPLQVALSGLEDRLYRRRLDHSAMERPVFIAGLPRSGTTLVLELCYQTGEFATHTYRQMPFVLTPLFWESFSKRFQKKTEARERAHGDGMLVSTDSPEALEEIVWMAFWRQHYEPTAIRPWPGNAEVDRFTPYLRRHMAKIVALSGSNTPHLRYLSKNNLNIARISWLLRVFPDARIVVPFREPRQHAASLLRQHGNFLAQQRQDSFILDYMRAIGHFDFGLNLRPVDFDGWLENARQHDPETLGFWLAYWAAAYRALLREAEDPRVQLLDFDALCSAPDTGLQALAGFLDLAMPDKLLVQATRLRVAETHALEQSGVAPTLLREVLGLYESLQLRTMPHSACG